MNQTRKSSLRHDFVHSGHKTFDRKANADVMTTGNVAGRVQRSSFIRAFHNTLMPDGHTQCEPGRLQKFDLENNFRHELTPPQYVHDEVLSSASHECVILYVFFHWVGNKRTIHGWILTTHDYQLIQKWYVNTRVTSRAVVNEAAQFVSM